MARPSQQDLAATLGVRVEQLQQLRARGMPVRKVREARAWFAVHGFRHVQTTPHGARPGVPHGYAAGRTR